MKTKDLILKLTEGNPGALRVVIELQWYRNWNDMLKWMLKTGLTGYKIWEKYKDEYREKLKKTLAFSLDIRYNRNAVCSGMKR